MQELYYYHPHSDTWFASGVYIREGSRMEKESLIKMLGEYTGNRSMFEFRASTLGLQDDTSEAGPQEDQD